MHAVPTSPARARPSLPLDASVRHAAAVAASLLLLLLLTGCGGSGGSTPPPPPPPASDWGHLQWNLGSWR
jgi:hypothetical protein